MYGRRGYRRSNYYSRKPRVPYQLNTKTFNGSAVNLSAQTSTVLLQNLSTTGKVTLARPTVVINAQAATAIPVYWAIVYVPDGYSENNMDLTSGNTLYEPNQFVMASGCFVADVDSEPFRLSSPLKRSLNVNDKVLILMRAAGTTGINFAATINYFTRNV